MPFIISGLAVGAIYGLAGTGLVITYKTSGIFNFAQPALAAIASYIFWYLHFDNITPGPQFPWPVAALIAVGVAGPLMGIGMERIARGLANVATSLQILATSGLALGIIGTLGLLYQNQGTLPYNPFLPTGTLVLGGTRVGYDQMILFAFSLAAVVGLYIFFRASKNGVQMRAVVDNPPLLDVMGTNPNKVRRWAWVIGCTFVAASGVLLGPTLATLQANSFLTIVIASFGAAAIGAFSSLPLTFIGGLAIGVIGDVSTKYVNNVSWLKGLSGALPFIVLFVVLIVTKPSKLAEKRVGIPKPLRESYYAPPRVRVVFAVAIFGFLALVPTFVGTNLSIWLEGLTYMILFLSLGLLVKLSGQVSLCQASLAAIGAATVAHAGTDWHLPWLICVLLAGLVTLAVGVIIAIPAIRVSGVFLALATFGFGFFLQQMIYPTGLMFGGTGGGLAAPRPSIASSEERYYYVVLAFLVVISALMVVIHYGRLGRLARALRDSPLALNTNGTSVTVLLVTVFAISAFVAGVAGALYASATQEVSLVTPLFAPLLSLNFFAVIMLVAAGIPWYGVLCGLALVVLPTYIGNWFNIGNIAIYTSLLFAIGAVTVALTAGSQGGVPEALKRFYERFRRERPLTAAATAVRPRPVGSGLEVRDLTVRYGGFAAVSGVSLAAPVGRITGLIGPNGAGKTTLFNTTSGLVQPSSGSIILNGQNISGMAPPTRARRGLGRTFQLVELWNTLTVRENVALGREASMAGASVPRQILAFPGEPAQIGRATVDAMDLTGTTPIGPRIVSDISTGERRLVELGRALAGPFDLLMLDEPSSGLDSTQTERFGALLRDAVNKRGIGILLVEHDMSLVTQVCDYIYVVDFGTLIYEGTPDDVMSSEAVRDAYLGTEIVTAEPATAVATQDQATS
jgi:ABC-type branched-subunit amino acid transport system ATPase component/branched-subunit amino acid ABC-type transport system permease component